MKAWKTFAPAGRTITIKEYRRTRRSVKYRVELSHRATTHLKKE